MRKFFERGSGKKMILAENADAESDDRCIFTVEEKRPQCTDKGTGDDAGDCRDF